jgi:hypothetical protein
MKSITIDIAENVYEKFKDFLELLPSDSYIIYEEDPDGLTSSEKKEVYSIKKTIAEGNLSDFTEWEDVKSVL